MSYEVFRRKVNALIKRAGGGINVRFSRDIDHGRHYARCSEGTVIIGSEAGNRVTVRWNGGSHQSMAEI